MTSRYQRAFTLIEMVIVIAITGAMAAAVALFLRWPFQEYLATARRAELSDMADTALRRMGRDLRIALPNSVRVTTVGATTYLEMLPTITGGRYRAAVDNTGAGDILDFTVADTSFDMFGLIGALPAGQAPVAGNRVVVYNLGAASVGADAYQGNNTNIIANTGAGTLANESKITFAAGAQRFPLASPGNTFQVISTPVTYTCTPGALSAAGDGSGTLTRTFGYAITAAQPTPPAGGTTALLANNIFTCNISYQQGLADTREAIVSMQIAITRSNETVNLYNEVHVSNAP